MFASPVRRPRDVLEMTLQRLREHNRLVTDVVLRDGAVSGQDITYLQSGVIVSFAACSADNALLVAVRALRNLKQAAAVAIGDRVESRIGLAIGDVIAESYHADAPRDLSGKPIEIAARLVSDIAKPGQIVLPAGTVSNERVERLATENEMTLALFPVPAAKLRIGGVESDIDVVEVTWDGASREVENWRQLARELTELKLASLTLQFELKKDGQDLAGGVKPTTFATMIDKLDPQFPQWEAQRLEELWNASGEARKSTDLLESMDQIDEARQRLVDLWRRSKRAIDDGGTPGRTAGKECVEEYERVGDALRRFSLKLSRALDQIQEMV